MMMHGYVNQFNNAINLFRGTDIAPLLRKETLRGAAYVQRRGSPLQKPLDTFLARTPGIDEYCQNQVPAPWDQMMAAHFKGWKAIQARQWVEACAQQAQLCKLFLAEFQLNDSSPVLLVPVVKVLLPDYCVLAKKADDYLESKGLDAKKLEDAARMLNQYFSVCIRDSTPLPQSKKAGTIAVVNTLIRIYFHLNNRQLCRNAIRPIKASNFPPLSQFPLSEVVTFRFYLGRLAMFEGNFKEAEEELEYVFQHCDPIQKHNLRLTLLFLTPVKMLCGKMPRSQLLRQHQLSELAELAAAVQQGNVRVFRDVLHKHQDFFVQRGIYLILEKLTLLTYRNLFKRVYLLLDRQTKIPLQLLLHVLQWQQVDSIDQDEVECIVANLIFLGYVKGYLSHKAATLVVSKDKAFPPAAGISL